MRAIRGRLRGISIDRISVKNLLLLFDDFGYDLHIGRNGGVLQLLSQQAVDLEDAGRVRHLNGDLDGAIIAAIDANLLNGHGRKPNEWSGSPC